MRGTRREELGICIGFSLGISFETLGTALALLGLSAVPAQPSPPAWTCLPSTLTQAYVDPGSAQRWSAWPRGHGEEPHSPGLDGRNAGEAECKKPHSTPMC